MPREHPLETRIPPPVGAALAALLQRALPGSPATSTRKAVAGGIALACVSLVADAERRMHREHTTIDPFDPARASALVTGGAFDLTRNPMYVAMAGVLTAHAVLRGNPMQLVPVAAWVGFIDRFQIRAEERALASNFGRGYDTYRQHVRRWL